MVRRIDAIYENGILRPLKPLDGLTEHAQVTVSVEIPERDGDGLSACVGTLPDEDAAELIRIIDQEFERVDPRDWQ